MSPADALVPAAAARPPAGELGQARVADLLEAVASDAPVPGGGGVCAAAAALAAALAGMAGRYALRRTPDSARFAELVKQADELRAQAASLWAADGAVYGQYVQATRLPRQPEAVRRRALAQAADASAKVPLQLASIAAEIAAVGEELAAAGNPNLRSDAGIATFLATATAAGAAVLVRDNLRASTGDPRIADADALAGDAADSAQKAAAALGLPLAGTGAP